MPPWYETVPTDSYLEYAFLRWVLFPAVNSGVLPHLTPQAEVGVGDRQYRLDYLLTGEHLRLAIELDGYAYHSDRHAFTHDRFRQNDLQKAGYLVVRFSYDAVRIQTGRCIEQLQAFLRSDPMLARFICPDPVIEMPDMNPDPTFAAFPRPPQAPMSYFDTARQKLSTRPLRTCQCEALAALAEYFRTQGRHAALVMSVGAGKTALGVSACLALTRQRALVVTPGSVIRGTFDRAFDHTAPGNALYGLPGGPLLPGCPPPSVLTLDRDDGPIRSVPREELLAAQVIITNFHSVGLLGQEGGLLSKLEPGDIDLVIVDEAHISAAESYQRIFEHFADARTILMSACFQRLDGRPIDADVVYRYRLIDSIADGHAKHLRMHRFEPDPAQSTYEIVWPDGRREELRGREAVLAVLTDERKLARITAKSNAPIRQIMTTVRCLLDQQAQLLHPVKPRVLFSALGEQHAEQIARLANEAGIPCDFLHHRMPESRIRAIRERFERDAGDLQGVVQLKMLGQGYDFPAITVVAPMRPYASFSEFYQFVGRGVRAIQHPALQGRVSSGDQVLDIVYHAELGLDVHVETICLENDMDPQPLTSAVKGEGTATADVEMSNGSRGRDIAEQADAFVLFERGRTEQRVVHDQERVEQRRAEREVEALAHRYAAYAAENRNPVTFEQFLAIMRQFRD
ncbi:DEAD/DEAH box helicase family protein [Deinococcus sonorensis]|uniref:DEAD/DEAH box helicase family protein n=1 Tax=Deinococcus sonorensis TaxID=309891 RepID=A0ABV8YEF4_9DEIO